MKRLFLTLTATLIGVMSFAQHADKMYTTENSAEFAKTIADPSIQLVDLRTPQEYDQRHIPGAMNINAQSTDFEAQAATLDKKRPVAIYCQSGARCKMAAEKLAKHGYKVYALDGGLADWKGKMTDTKKMADDKMHDAKHKMDNKMHDAKKMADDKMHDTKKMVQ